MRCANCGQENPDQAKFCLKCAAPFALRCAGCGTELPPNAKFCFECALPVGQAVPSPEREPRDYTPKHLADKILQSKSALEGERKQVTVLFADVKGSLELAEQVDPEEWHRILDRFFQILADGVHRFEGTVNQYTGDGIMALFGAPISHEDHAQRACYAALHLRDELRRYAREVKRAHGLGFSVRVGVNSGEVVVGKIGDDLRMDYTAQGRTVGLAARMQELAEPGNAYLTGDTAALISGYFELEDLGTFHVRGASDPVPVFQLQGLGTMRTRFDLSRARGLTRFVGRADDMEALEAALAQARERSGQVVGVVAEAGVGKSRLCFEFAERCRARGILVLEGRAVAHGKQIPFLPVLQIFRAYFGVTDRDSDRAAREKIAGRMLLIDEEFREVLPVLFEFLGVPDPDRPAPEIDPEARQRQLFGVVRRLMESGDRGEGFVILIEDLHWLDGGSERFLEQWVEAIDGRRGLLLVNFRPEYRAAWMQKSTYRQSPLLPLGPEAVVELLDDLLGSHASVAGLAHALYEVTKGNPFFTEELVRSLIEEGKLEGARGSYRLLEPIEKLKVPASVQALLASRIDRLPEREKRVLQRAAVIGREFAEPILQAVAELPARDLCEALGALKAADFVYQQALYPVAEYAFKHPLTQEVALGSQLQERRRGVHAAVARAIEELQPERLEERAALLAHHWEGAGDPLRAAQCHRRAAEWAGFSDPTQALRHWRAVQSLALADSDPEEAGELALRACVWILRFGWRVGFSEEEASTVFRQGRRLAEQRGDLHALARLCSVYAFFRAPSPAAADETLDLLRQSEHLAREIGAPAFTLHVAPDWAAAYHTLRLDHQALRIIDETLKQAKSDPRLAPGIEGLRAYSLLLCTKTLCLQELGRLEESNRVTEKADRLAREHGWAEILYWTTAGFSYTAYLAGDAGGALRYARDAAQMAERIGALNLRTGALFNLGAAYLAGGHWGEARETLEGSLASSGRRFRDSVALTYLAEACLGAGDPETARTAVDEAVSLERGRRTTAESNALLGLAHVLLRTEGIAAAGQIEEALSEAGRLSEEAGSRLLLPHIHSKRSELARLRGDDATRRHELREAQRLFSEMGATGHAKRLAKELGP